MIVLCAGGTGGHVFPAESLADTLKKRGYKVALITDSRAMNFVNYELFDKILVLNVRRSNPVIYFFSILKNILKAVIFLIKNKVQAVVGFGGYPSLPGVLAAQILFKKNFLHEQNAVLGRANNLLRFLSDGLAVSFENTKKAPANSVWIGNPVRELVRVTLDTPKAVQEKFNLIVVGGSQGSTILSQVIPSAVKLLPKAILEKLYIVQQCRDEDIEFVKSIYLGLDLSFKIRSFFNDLPALMRQSDLAICRAGASTVAELSCLGLPAIFVPLAIAKDSDQSENALRIVNSGGAEIILEKEFTADNLAKKLQSLILNSDVLDKMAKNMLAQCKINANELLSDWLESKI